MSIRIISISSKMEYSSQIKSSIRRFSTKPKSSSSIAILSRCIAFSFTSCSMEWIVNKWFYIESYSTTMWACVGPTTWLTGTSIWEEVCLTNRCSDSSSNETTVSVKTLDISVWKIYCLGTVIEGRLINYYLASLASILPSGRLEIFIKKLHAK